MPCCTECHFNECTGVCNLSTEEKEKLPNNYVSKHLWPKKKRREE